jgi:trimeric autotransporter adhesin
MKRIFLGALLCSGLLANAQNALPSTGNVGINTLTPSEKLEVKDGNIKVNNGSLFVTIPNVSSSSFDNTTNFLRILETNSYTLGSCSYNNNRSLNYRGGELILTGAGSAVCGGYGGGGGSETRVNSSRVYLSGGLSLGKIPIGQTLPYENQVGLFSTGALNIGSAAQQKINFFTSGNWTSSMTLDKDGNLALSQGGLSTTVSNVMGLTINSNNTNDHGYASAVYLNNPTTKALSTHYGGQETFAVWGNGNVYTKGNLVVHNGIVQIGTVKTPLSTNSATPVGYKLYVEEGILTEKVRVALKTTAEWADYVFAKDYKLAKLDSVESYIKEHQHLPGVPSAQEMVDKGLDVAKTDAMLMQKLEELTLYVIALDKQNKKLMEENSQIKEMIANKR